MRRRPILLLAGIPALLLAADLYSEIQIGRPQAEDAYFRFVTSGGQISIPGPGAALRAMTGARRGEVVKALGDRAKAYYASEAFRKRYAAWWAEQQPAPPSPMKTLAQLKQEQKDQGGEQAKAMQEMEANLKNLPPETRAEVKKAMAQAREAQGQLPAIDDQTLLRAEQERFQTDQRNYQEALQKAPVKDPKVQLRKALQHTLAATEGIDYSAALRSQYGKRVFVNAAFESKPAEWKMGFRAGREATEAARAYARAWLQE